jgi:hypothetical protein
MKINEDEKALWLEDWQKSGKSAWTYAKENGLNPQTFVRWTKGNPKNNACLVEVSAGVLPVIEYGREILVEKGEVRIHIPLSIGCGELRMIIGIVAGMA